MSAQGADTDEECKVKPIPVWSHKATRTYANDAAVVGALEVGEGPCGTGKVLTTTCWTPCKGGGDEVCTAGVPNSFQRLLAEVQSAHVRELEELRARLEDKAEYWSTEVASEAVAPLDSARLEVHSQWRASTQLQQRKPEAFGTASAPSARSADASATDVGEAFGTLSAPSARSADASATDVGEAFSQGPPERKARLPPRAGSQAASLFDISSESPPRRNNSRNTSKETVDEVPNSNLSSEYSLKAIRTQMPSPKRSPQMFVRWIVHRQAFDIGSCGVIVANAVLLGMASDAGLKNAADGKQPDDLPVSYDILTYIFTAWFCLELSMRCFAQGPREFLSGEEWTWNIFDAFVVFTDLLETSLSFTLTRESRDGSVLHNLAVLRMLRIMRLTRAVRIVRLIRFFKSLRMMVYSVLLSTSSLLWSLLMLMLTICIFGIYFAQIVSYHLHGLPELPSPESPLRVKFGSLVRTMYTLYLAISGGISWGEVGELLIEIDWFHGMVLCFFTFFTTFALLNIVNGIFVDTAIRSAESDKDYVIQETLHSTKRSLEELRKLFIVADLDRSGSITLPELEAQLRKKEVGAHLRSIGIEVGQARSLFKLLDLDGSGEITIEEFVCGCMRLKGAAKSLDLATIMYENRRMQEQWRRFFVWSDQKFQQQTRFEQRVEEQLAVLGHR